MNITTLRDYRDFIELTLYYLNGEHNALFKFRKPGPIHIARWMSKVIYCIKTCLSEDIHIRKIIVNN